MPRNPPPADSSPGEGILQDPHQRKHRSGPRSFVEDYFAGLVHDGSCGVVGADGGAVAQPAAVRGIENCWDLDKGTGRPEFDRGCLGGGLRQHEDFVS